MGSPWRSFLLVGISFNDPIACAAARLRPLPAGMSFVVFFDVSVSGNTKKVKFRLLSELSNWKQA